jgi:dolichyl-phosphate beta-glucosyltransferase
MYGFHTLVRILCSKNIKDTQCGFKLFEREAAFKLFENLHLHRWAFDIELIYLAESLGYQVSEVKFYPRIILNYFRFQWFGERWRAQS